MATILVVEERPVNRRFVVTLLQDRGHRLLEAADSEGALRVVRAEKPDLVLVDVLAPRAAGGGGARRGRGEEEEVVGRGGSDEANPPPASPGGAGGADRPI